MPKRKKSPGNDPKPKQQKAYIPDDRLQVLLRELDPACSVDLTKIRANSRKLLPWKCAKCLSLFFMKLVDRTRGEYDCLHCAPPEGQFAHCYPDLIIREWMDDKNGFRLGDKSP